MNMGNWGMLFVAGWAVTETLGAGLPYKDLLKVMEQRRPYELDWANKTQDEHTPLFRFNRADGWRLVCTNAAATFATSEERTLFGKGVCKLTYRATGPNPEIWLYPRQDTLVTNAFNAVTLWVNGNNHNLYSVTPGTPSVSISVLFTATNASALAAGPWRENFMWWSMFHHRFSAREECCLRPGTKFRAIRITGGTNTEDRAIYFNSLSCFQEVQAPLQFKERARRGFQLFPECPQGVNTGKGRLPFPNTPMTIIPPDSAKASTRAAKDGDGYLLRREGPDGILEVRLPAKLGEWDDMTFRWNGSPWYPFTLHGGLEFYSGGGEPKAWGAGKKQKASLEETSKRDDGESVYYESTLRDKDGALLANAKARFRLCGKSLVIDLSAPGGKVSDIHTGSLGRMEDARPISLPYYSLQMRGRFNLRPLILGARINGKPFYLMSMFDWTQSNSSFLSIRHDKDPSLTSLGKISYFPDTAGKVNDCYERLVYAFSPNLEETFVNIPNPPSPYKEVAGKNVYTIHFADYDRTNDYRACQNLYRKGLRHLTVASYETSSSSDPNASIAFRVKASPDKGGDEGQIRYNDFLQKALGFNYCFYDNFCDLSPYNEYWSTDMILRTQENRIQPAFERAYKVKPARAVEFAELLSPQIAAKLHNRVFYCDVHSTSAPWQTTDYDHRVPGAAVGACVFYSYGEIFLLQKQAINGPVYSEGGTHFLYSGLADGNFAQDNGYEFMKNPWVVDFDLRRIHDLCCNFGFDDCDTFNKLASESKNRTAFFDAADIMLAGVFAFGHPLYLLGNLDSTDYSMRSYYMAQAIAARYTQERATAILYFDKGGKGQPVSEAIFNHTCERNQIHVEYSGGTKVWVNANRTEMFTFAADGKRVTLPPFGYWLESGDGTTIVQSDWRDGRRIDISISPEYIFINGRGKLARTPYGVTDGMLARLPRADGTEEIIVDHSAKRFGVPYKVACCEIVDVDGNAAGQAKTRQENGYTFIERASLPFFTYRVQKAKN